jgi:hypothetical protein
VDNPSKNKNATTTAAKGTNPYLLPFTFTGDLNQRALCVRV